MQNHNSGFVVVSLKNSEQKQKQKKKLKLPTGKNHQLLIRTKSLPKNHNGVH